MTAPTIVWFRRDLRLADNPALRRAVSLDGPVVPVFLWSPAEDGEWPPGAASRYWLHQSLTALVRALGAAGSRLVLRRGPAGAALGSLIRETGAGTVVWNRCYEPAALTRDGAVETALGRLGVAVESFNGSLLWEPGRIANRQGGPFKVYTPFWKRCRSLGDPGRLLAAPAALAPPRRWPGSVALDDYGLEPAIDWAEGIRKAWRFGATGARDALDGFVKAAMARYPEDRDRPDRAGVSRLSPYLTFGELSPRQVWHGVRAAETEAGRLSPGAPAEAYLRQLIWREFAQHLLFHFPHTSNAPLRDEFAAFPWSRAAPDLRAWQRGLTGYPIVDAGMRELWHTGWMHNRVRMVVASFLVKDLMIHWQEGARWFWDTLVDADLANNTLGWQWVAGCGADAAPFFRVFNPVMQGRKFDPDGRYVRRWLPALTGVPDRHVHDPWNAPDPPPDYPAPIVDHGKARERALAAYRSIRR